MSAGEGLRAGAVVVTRWRHGRWSEPHEADPTNVTVRAEGGLGAHPLYAECRTCHESLIPATFALLADPAPVADEGQAAGLSEAELQALGCRCAAVEYVGHAPGCQVIAVEQTILAARGATRDSAL